jgi:hypothetical protein
MDFWQPLPFWPRTPPTFAGLRPFKRKFEQPKIENQRGKTTAGQFIYSASSLLAFEQERKKKTETGKRECRNKEEGPNIVNV